MEATTTSDGIDHSNPLSNVEILYSAVNLDMHMNHYRQPSFGQLAKGGFLLGVMMFLVGTGGEWMIHAHVLALPAWEEALFFDMEVLGVLFFLLSPFVFGILFPLIEG